MPKEIDYRKIFTEKHDAKLWEKAMEICRKYDDVETAKVVIRSQRNRLLRESDARMALDRLGLTKPAWTLAGLIEFIKTMVNALTGDWAVYRQALRDITKQPGFPFNVEWPEKPEED